MTCLLVPVRWYFSAIAFAFTINMTACQQHTNTSPAQDSTKSAMVPLTIDEIRIGPSSDPSKMFQQQTSDAPIVVAIKTHGASRGANFQVSLFNLKNGAKAGDLARHVATRKPTVTIFRFENASGWASGRYLVEVRLDGKLVGQRDVDISEMAKPGRKE